MVRKAESRMYLIAIAALLLTAHTVNCFSTTFDLFISSDSGQEAVIEEWGHPPFLDHQVRQTDNLQKADYQVQRYSPVELNGKLSAKHSVTEGDTLTITLFDGQMYKGIVDRITKNINTTISIRGRIIEYPEGYIIISTTGNRTLGKIRIPETGEMYLIKSDYPQANHYLLDVGDENNHYLESAPPPIPPDERQRESRMDQRIYNQDKRPPGPDDPAIIDVMIVYTPAAANWSDINGGGIMNVVAQTMEISQLAHDNSNTLVELYLIHSTMIGYTESGSALTDIYRLTYHEDWDPHGREGGPPWYMDEVHEWRDEYGADLVAMLAFVSDVGGLGWQLSTTQGRPQFGFSLTRVQQAAHTYTFVHELGHNMGCHHHRDQNTSPGPGLFDYSAGWRWTQNNSRYCTVMTYMQGRYFDDGLNHTRLPYFSSPLIEFQGVAVGHRDLADNSRTIRETKHVIAGYRDDVINAPNVTLRMNDNDEAVISWQEVTIANSYKIYTSVNPYADFEDWMHIATTDRLLYIAERFGGDAQFYQVIASRERIEE